MKREEKRGFLRIDENIPVSYHRLLDASAITTKTLDISGGGIKIVCKSPIAVDEIVQIKLNIPTRKSSIFCTGKVVWVKKDTKNNVKNYCGISFINIHSKDREDIVEYVFFQSYKLQEKKDMAVSISNLTKKYGKVVALDNIDLQIKQGEVFVLFGKNGSGKTTFLKILSTIISPTSGNIEVLGYDILSCKNKVKNLVRYMPEVPTLKPLLSMRENLYFFAKKHNIKKEEVPDVIEELLEFFNIYSEGDSLCKTLSPNLKQQLSFAISLLGKPQILLLDEPTKNFTKSYIPSFWKYINKMSENKITILITTNNLKDIEFSDRSAIISDGKIIAIDKPQEIKKIIKTKSYKN